MSVCVCCAQVCLCVCDRVFDKNSVLARLPFTAFLPPPLSPPPPRQVLKGCKKLAMSVCSVGRIPGGYITNHIYTWVDPQGRSVSPPCDLQETRPDSLRRGHSLEGMERTVRSVCVCCVSVCVRVCGCRSLFKLKALQDRSGHCVPFIQCHYRNG